MGILVGTEDFDKGRVRARRCRNRRIGEFLKELRLTEGRGTGIPTIVKALRDNGSGAAEFDTNEPSRTHFLIEIPIHPSFNDQANDQANDLIDRLSIEHLKVLKYCEKPRRNKDIQEKLLHLVSHTYNFQRYIEPLLEKGLLVRTIPEKPTSRNQRYITSK